MFELLVAKPIYIPILGLWISKKVYMPILIILVALILNKTTQTLIKKPLTHLKNIKSLILER